MRSTVLGWGCIGLSVFVASLFACGGSGNTGFTNPDGGSSSGGGSSGGGSGSGSGGASGSGGSGGGSGSSSGIGGTIADSGGGTTTTSTTIYAHTDTILYSLDPQTKAVTPIGTFTGLGGSSGDDSITDLAVNAAGNVFVNSETVIYQATLPTGGTGNVALTKLATISNSKGGDFYALGFTTKDALGTGTGEVLIGGDGNGELWSIDQTTGATKDLGSFGADPSNSSSVLALSGDIVFYNTSSGTPLGLATIRACTTSSKGTNTCDGTSDYLAGINMTALANAYGSGTPAPSLNGGIYGSPSQNETGPGTGFKDVFGLGVWNGTVYGFTRSVTGVSASLLSIDTTTGQGTIIPETVSISNGWSGAGVTTTVTVSIPNPPLPPQ
jgi:hypothetical protein